MDEATLPERLRYLSTRFALSEYVAQTGDVLREAADELERLTRTPAPPGDLIDPSDVIYALRYGLETPGYVGTEHDLTMRREALRLLSTATLARLELGEPPVEQLRGYAELVREGVPAPTVEPRRFAAHYRDPSTGAAYAPPAPGSFVFCGPALAVWRVLGVEPLDGDTRGTHALELEPVDAHDVPMLSRVAEVPLPVSELVAEPERGPVDAVLADPERSLGLCSARWTPAQAPDGPALSECVCVRVHAHDGEHLFRWDGGELPVDFRWDGPPRVVDCDSPEAQDALWREGQGGAPSGSGGVPIADGGPWERSE